MIEIRYRVVNKYLTEIRDIDVKESSSNGKTGSVTVTNPLHCKAGEYLNTNLVFYDDSFNKSLNSGLLKSYLMSGAVKQVWYDTVLKKEVAYPTGQPMPSQQSQQDSATNELAQMFKEAGITKDDLKDIVALLKEKKQPKQEEPIQQTINQAEEQATNPKPKKARKPRTKVAKPVDKSNKPVDKNLDNIKKNTEKSMESKVVNNFDKVVNNALEKEKAKINTFNYQQRLNYIKQCNDLDILKWIQSQFHQVAIFNAVSNKINELETMKAGK